MAQRDAASSRWTYDEYARLPNDGDRYEIIRGELCVTPGPRPRHQWVLARLLRQLQDYVEAHRLGVVLADVDLLFVSGEFLRPDLVFVPTHRLDGITTRGVEVPPQLVVEVLSPGSERIDRLLKPQRYAEHGVPEYWLVDPDAANIEVHRLKPAVAEKELAEHVLHWQPDPAVASLALEVAPLFVSW